MEQRRNGWLCPDGSFIEAEPTPPVRTRGLSLGGHEQAALGYLMEPIPGNAGVERMHLYDELVELANKEARRLNIDFNDWTDLDGYDIIKRFMECKGFKRIAENE